MFAAGSAPFVAPLVSPLIPSTSANFSGIGETGWIPPDPSGAVGTSQYVEVVNATWAVYSKTGTALRGPEATSALWSGFGGVCEKNSGGDGTVLFDTINQRWVVQQLAFKINGFNEPEAPYLDCVAVSETSDATGKWYRYAFEYNKTLFPDYPKMGVWPDAYYVSVNLYGAKFAGPQVCALNRSAMLKGEAASGQCFEGTENSGFTLLPATLDGATQPSVGEVEYFVADSPTESNALAYWKFHVDWSNPANTTFTGPTNLKVEPFSPVCEQKVESEKRGCVPQSGTTQHLEGEGERLMYRLAYRNFGTYQAMVVAQSVLTEPKAGEKSGGMRWYELRASNQLLSVYQQGTYAPDSSYRWMGSIAMDHAGDMALGYSVSSSSLHPQIRYTGRLVSDALGTMPQGEATLYEGAASQIEGELKMPFRWGDYTEMSVDPADECTFWYVNEYHATAGETNWRTRVGSFKFPSCDAAENTSTALVRDPSTGEQWVYYVDSNHEIALWSYTTAWANSLLGGSVASGTSPAAVRNKGTGNSYVYYVGSNSGIWVQEYIASTKKWTNKELQHSGLGGEKAAANTRPAVVLNEPSGLQYVYYPGANNAMWLWWYSPTTKEWTNEQLEGTAKVASGTYPAVVRNERTGSTWVYYTGSNGGIWVQEYIASTKKWTNKEVQHSGIGGEKAAASTSPTIVRQEEPEAEAGLQWVYYTGSNGRVWTWWYAPSTKVWTNEQIGGEVRSGTSPMVVRKEATGDQWVYYIGSNNGVWGWTYTSSIKKWADSEVGGKAAGNITPSAVRDATSGNQWLYFIGSNLGVWELGYNSGIGWGAPVELP